MAATATRPSGTLRRAGRGLVRRALRVRARTWGIVVGVLAVVIGFGLWFRDSSFVDVRNVTIVGANGPQASQIREALRTAALDQTTLHFNDGKLRDAVISYPLVTGVSASTHFPHAVTITVRENVPVAAILAGGVRTAATADGRLLHDAPNMGSLPTIGVAALPAGGRLTGGRALEALKVIAAAPPALSARVTRISTTSAHGVVVQFRRGPVAYFGGVDALADKWAALASVLANSASSGASYIDVTVPRHPAAGGVGGAPGVESDTPQVTTTTPSPSTTQP